MRSPVTVDLGTHSFGSVRAGDARVASAAWGHADGEAGLEGGPQESPAGASSFDVDASGVVTVVHYMHQLR